MKGSTSCTRCPAGFMAQEKRSVACIPCLPGKYMNELGNTICSSCIAGKYSDDLNAATCKHCQDGATSKVGNTSCAACANGKFRNDDTAKCENCPTGWSRSDKVHCTLCDLGSDTGDESGQTYCSFCDVGKYGSKSGTCSDCPAGFFQDGKGETLCKECDIDTYLDETGSKSKANCKSCDNQRTTGRKKAANSINECICKKDAFYQKPDRSCVACPDGAKCDRDGMPLLRVYPSEGYWRSDNQTDVFTDCASAFPSDPEAQETARLHCCPLDKNGISTCANLTFAYPDEQCFSGYQGPLCAGCAPNFTQFRRDCNFCEGGSSVESVYHALLSCLGVFYLIVVIILLRVKKDRKHADTESIDGSVQGKSSITGPAKILIMFGQLLSSMPVAFDGVPWPASFIDFLKGIGAVVNLDFFTPFTVAGSCALAIPSLEKFTVHMTVPPLLAATVLLAYFTSLICLCRYKNKEEQTKIRTVRIQTSIKIVMFVAQIMYPGLATRIL